jgi:phosphate transport system substrate-binding protein
MKKSELEANHANGNREITEVCIGYDGIALAHHVDNAPLHLGLEEVFRAVARMVPVDGKLVENPYTKWSEINPDLPDAQILVFGPPTTSGTRDAFHELVMHKVAKTYKDLYEPMVKKAQYQEIRDDGLYVDAGENDNLIVQKLEKDKTALGIFGYSFLEENGDRVQGAIIDGVAPEPAKISSGEYPISRSLFFYVKNAHLDMIPGLSEFVDLFVSEKMIGERGYLKKVGLIPLPKEMREQVRADVSGWKNLSAEDLH